MSSELHEELHKDIPNTFDDNIESMNKSNILHTIK